METVSLVLIVLVIFVIVIGVGSMIVMFNQHNSDGSYTKIRCFPRLVITRITIVPDCGVLGG